MSAKRKLGDCFQIAWQIVAWGTNKPSDADIIKKTKTDKDTDLTLVHGLVRGTGILQGKMFWHAWAEDKRGFVIDKANGSDHYLPKSVYYHLAGVSDKYPTMVKYKRTEAMKLGLQKGHYGPWHKEADDYVTEEIANAAGGGHIAGLGIGPDGEPGRSSSHILRRKKVAGVECFEVAPEFYYNCRFGKRKFLRYEKYVGNDEVGEAIRQYARDNPNEPVMVQNRETRAIMYLRYGKGRPDAKD